MTVTVVWLRMGIKAAQVIDFLIMHAHPLVKYKDNILPGKLVVYITTHAYHTCHC